ncbi:AAA family ATPase (plasmid) [Micromonospora zamorensis]|uniref:UvrD-helicase domain-containing protein n=1 Tax=Micromonospora zamorensis TaxID=709883 RepID=UPI002E1C5E56
MRDLLGDDGYRAARATTLNAHYTHAGYVEAVWSALGQLGFTGGTVLEPGCGIGPFIGLAPEGARPVGIELDPITAWFAQALYPQAQIRPESFADTRVAEGGFDAVIGNVPFGQHKLHDPAHNPGRQHPIHNHFILKSLRATRPGGLVALITSRYTMDGKGDGHQRAREQMGELADLIGAVRLPTDAHRVAAGTDVVTDLLIFRRRPDGQEPAPTRWLEAKPVQAPAGGPGQPSDTFEVNEYFLQHPEMVLGQQVTVSGRNRPVLAVVGDGDTSVALEQALDRMVAHAQASGLTMTPGERPRDAEVILHGPAEEQEGLFIDLGDGRFTQIRDGRSARHDPPKNQIAELRALIGLRQTILSLLDEEASNREDTPLMGQLRDELNRRYATYFSAYGAINRFSVSVATVRDKTTQELVEQERRTYPRLGGFRDDPFFPYVAALEKFDDETQRAEKADVFHQRVIAVPTPVQRVDDPADAVIISWDQHNEVRLSEIARLLGLDSEQDARQAIDALVFEEPGSGALIRKAEYLSGNVRHKLAAAQRAAADDPRFAANVEALQQVVPRDLTPAEIGARLGSPWISARYVQQFLQEILEDETVKVSNIGARWSVSGANTGVLATTVWGTKGRVALDLASNLLNSQNIEVTKTLGQGADRKTVRDTEATAFAQAKSQQMDERFRAWLWEDPERAKDLSRIYNDRFNALVPRSYEGAQISAPGMSTAYQLRPHQMAAVERIRNSAGVGLFHGTGAGKTLEMIVGGMELVRLGLASKPAYVVPKAVRGQFVREFLHAYPGARVLTADSEDLTGDKRRRFVGRWSTGDWDAVIITHHAFEKIPVSRNVKIDYMNRQLERLQKHLDGAEDADRYTVKDIEKQIAVLQEQLQEVMDTPTDAGVEFERTGSSYLFVDEAHVYKNLRVVSSIPELAHKGNKITADLDMKLGYLRRAFGQRVVCLATATPIDNSPSELLTMIKYAAPELLTDMGIEEDDQYHAAFIQPRRRVEMRPDGSGFQSRTRHSRYVNVQEQKLALYQFADVKLKEHLNLNEPAIVGGEPEIISVPASTELQRVLVDLGLRAKDITSGQPAMRLTTKGEWRKDNILWVSTDGRQASLAVEFAGMQTDEPQKLDVAADYLYERWLLHKDDVYHRADGTPEPERGSLFLVFCDLGVPKKGWNAYDALRDRLVARGVPADQVRYDQDAKNRRQKEQLDQDARDGKFFFLFGSRAGLGTGRNIQRRAIGVMQVDPVWKMTPLEQSIGRAKRQGNLNTEIYHAFVITEGSYDPFLWQKVDDKARFTRQMLDPNDTTRVIDVSEDDGSGKIDPSVMLAVAAGRPELLQLAHLEEAVGALRLEQRIWGDEQFNLKASVQQDRRTIVALTDEIATLEETITRRRDTRGDAFHMTINGVRFEQRPDAGAVIAQQLTEVTRPNLSRARKRLTLGELGGVSITGAVEWFLDMPTVALTIQGVPGSTINLDKKDLDGIVANGATGLVRRLENRLADADKIRDHHTERIARLEANIIRAEARVGQPFPKQDDLQKCISELDDLHKQLDILDKPPADGSDTTGVDQVQSPPTGRSGTTSAAPSATVGPSTTAPTTGSDERATAAVARTGTTPSTTSAGVERTGPSGISEQTSAPARHHGQGLTLPESFQRPGSGVPAWWGPHGVINELLDWARGDVGLLALCRHNALDEIRQVVVNRLADRIADASAAGQSGNDDQLNEFVKIYFGPDAAVKDTLDTFLVEEIFTYARTPVSNRAVNENEGAIPVLWALTQSNISEGQARTRLVRNIHINNLIEDALRGTDGQTANWVGSRTTVRDSSGDVLWTAERLDLPWRGWCPKEADTVHLGRGPVHYVKAERSPDEGPWEQRDARDVLRRAESAQRPVAVTDWGVLTLFAGGLSGFVRSDGKIPDVPEVMNGACAVDPALQPYAMLANAITDRAMRDDNLVRDARSGPLESFQSTAAAWVGDQLNARRGDDTSLIRALADTYFTEPASQELLNHHIAVSVYWRAHTEGEVPAASVTGIQHPLGHDDTAAAKSENDDEVGLPETKRTRRGHDFYPPAEAGIPALYDTAGIPSGDIVIYAHYFSSNSDYWIAEYDPRVGRAFGYACVNGDADGAEWGYSYLPELEAAGGGLNIVERDLYWTPRPASDLDLPGQWASRRQTEARPEVPAAAPPAPEPFDEPVHGSAASERQEAPMTTAPASRVAPLDGPAGLGVGLLAEFAGGTPYTSSKRIRGPLQDVRKAYNALARTAGWKRGGSRVTQLATTAQLFAVARVGETSPWDLLIHSVTMARHVRELANHPAELDDPSRAMLTNLVRAANTLANDLVATLQKDGRWERIFGGPFAPPAPVEPPSPAASAERVPQVHRFASTEEAYDAAQVRDDIQSGDVLLVDAEDVVGVLDDAWPVALSPQNGMFHTLVDDEAKEQFNTRYAASVQLAEAEIRRIERRNRPVPAALAQVPLGDDLPATNGQHIVSRMLAGRTVVFVEARHPQHPELEPLPRGRIRLVSADDAATPQFNVTDFDSNTADTTFDSYDSAERQLLEMTANVDVPLTAEELQEMLAFAEPEDDAEDQTSASPSAPAEQQPSAAAVMPEGGEPVPTEAPYGQESKPQPAARPDSAPTVATAVADATATSSPTPAVILDERHPDQIVACSCCRPTGAEVTGPVADAGSPPRPAGGPLTYARLPIGVTRGPRWLKLVALNHGRPASALAFIDPRTQEWYAPAGWKSPNKRRPMDAAERQWALVHLPMLAASPDRTSAAAPNRPAAPRPSAQVEGIRLHVEGRDVTVLGTRGGPDEQALRAVFRDNGFYYDGEDTKAWKMGGWRISRGTQTDRAAAVAAVQAWIDANRAPAEVAKKFPPTPQQQAVIDAYLDGRTIVVQALAGTGKTSTLQMLAEVRPDARVAYIAFNKTIAAEAQGKFGSNVTAQTSHSFARTALSKGPLRDKLRTVVKKDGWPGTWASTLKITDQVYSDRTIEAETQARWVIATVKSFRQSAAETISVKHLPDGLRDQEMAPLRLLILEAARKAWEDKADPVGQLPFVHDDYLKLWALQHPRLPYDVIFFDEAQDINPVLAKLIKDQSAQKVVVGDSNQSIYSFRGAVDALNHWPADVVLPLTQSWRFGPGVAKVGNSFLQLIGSPYLMTGNPGMTTTIGPVDDPEAVLAFTNAGCVTAVFDGFEAHKDVALLGGGKAIKEIAQAALDLQAGRGTTHPELSRFADWVAVQEYVDGDDEEAQSLQAFVRLVDRRGAEELIKMADRLTDEKATRPDGTPAYDLTVSTVHKSKGLEWDRVRIANDGPRPDEDLATGKITLPDPEKLRQAYVALTRARRSIDLGSLAWIQEYPMEKLLAAAARDQRRRRVNKGAVTPRATTPVAANRELTGAANSTPPVEQLTDAKNIDVPAASDGRPSAPTLARDGGEGAEVQAQGELTESEVLISAGSIEPNDAAQLTLTIDAMGEDSNLTTTEAELKIPLEEVTWGTYGRIKAMGPDGSRCEETGYVTLVPREFTGGLGDKQKYRGEPILHFVMGHPSTGGYSVGMNALPGAMFTVLDPPADRPLRIEPTDSRRMPVRDTRAGDVVEVLFPVEGRPWDRPGPQVHLTADPKPLSGGGYELTGRVNGVIETHQMLGDTWVNVEGPAVRHMVEPDPAATLTVVNAGMRELPPPGEVDPVARWQLLGSVSAGTEPTAVDRRQRMFAAMRRVHELPEDTSLDEIRVARDADDRRWRDKCLAYWDAYAALMTEQAVPRTAAAEPFPKAAGNQVDAQAAPTEAAVALAGEASESGIGLTPAGPDVDSQDLVASEAEAAASVQPSTGAKDIPRASDASMDRADERPRLSREVQRMLETVAPGGDIRWAAGAYHLSLGQLNSFWQSGDVRHLADTQGGNSLERARWFRHDRRGCTVTDGSDVVATATWREIAEFVTPSRVGPQLIVRAGELLRKRRDAIPPPGAQAPEVEARWREVNDACRRLTDEVWRSCREDPRPQVDGLFEVEPLVTPVRSTADAAVAPADAAVAAAQDDQPTANAEASTDGISAVPAHSPYELGDRVQMHGFASASSDLGRTGFIGIVHGHIGSTLLTGVTDGGQTWTERWGVLVSEGAPNRSAVACTCCPQPGRQPAKEPTPAVSLTRTRMSIGSQIQEAANILGLPCEPRTVDGTLTYEIAGQRMSPGEAADYLLEGGIEGARGRAETLVHPDRLAERSVAASPQQQIREHPQDRTAAPATAGAAAPESAEIAGAEAPVLRPEKRHVRLAAAGAGSSQLLPASTTDLGGTGEPGPADEPEPPIDPDPAPPASAIDTTQAAASAADPAEDVTAGIDPGPFSAVELAKIRAAVQDHAAKYYGQRGALHFGESDAVRYVSEGHLGGLVRKHGLSDVWDAVAATIAQDRAVLTHDPKPVRAALDAASEMAGNEIKQLLDAGDHEGALNRLDAAELANPHYQLVGRRSLSWDDIRTIIQTQANGGVAPRRPGMLGVLDELHAALYNTPGVTPAERERIGGTTVRMRSNVEAGYNSDEQVCGILEGWVNEHRDNQALAAILDRAARQARGEPEPGTARETSPSIDPARPDDGPNAPQGPDTAAEAQPSVAAAVGEDEEVEDLLAELAEEAEARAGVAARAAREDGQHLPSDGHMLSAPTAELMGGSVLTDAEHAFVAHACEDYAGDYTGDPLHASPEDPERGVSHNHLDVLVERHGIQAVSLAVRRHLAQNPEILAAGPLTSLQREQQRIARDEHARSKSSEALREFKAGNYNRALDLLAEGEVASPGFRPSNGTRTWEDLGAFVRQAAAAADSVLSKRRAQAVPPSEHAAAASAGPENAASRESSAEPVTPTAAQPDTVTAEPLTPTMQLAGKAQVDDSSRRAAVAEEAGRKDQPETPDATFQLLRDGQPPRTLNRTEALNAFSAMIGQAEAGAKIAGRLAYADAFISIGRTSGKEPRLRIAYGTRKDHQDAPLKHAWPAPAAHAAVFDRIIERLENRDATRQSTGQLKTGRAGQDVAAVLRRLHGAASRNPAELIYMPHGAKAQSIALPAGLDRFAEMIEAVQRTGSAPGELAWRGVAIRAHLDDGGQRLAITIASGKDQLPVPVASAWPGADERADLLRAITNYIDRAGQHANRMSQVGRDRPRAAASSAPRPARAATAGVGNPPSTVSQSFPGRAGSQAGGEGRPSRPVEQPVGGAGPAGRLR